MAAVITKGGTLPDTGVTKNEVYALVDNATITGISDAEITGTLAFTRTNTTTNCFSITGSSLTTGRLGRLYSNSADTSTRYLVDIVNDNPLATGARCLLIQQTSTAAGIQIDQTGNGSALSIPTALSTTANVISVSSNTLTTGSLGYFNSNSADTSARNLVSIVNDNAAAVEAVVLNIQQDGGGNSRAVIINTLGTVNAGLIVTASSLTTGNIAEFSSNSADTNARYLVTIINDNASADAAICLKLQQDGDGQQILGTGNENLSAAGVWTDRTSTYADKTDITPLVVDGFIDKLKTLKLFEYRKKCEVYGNKQDILHETEKDEKGEAKVVGKEYRSVVKHADAPIHKGYILDDPSTPEELISRNLKGEIDGISATKNTNFLLAVCKELISRVELLEKK